MAPLIRLVFNDSTGSVGMLRVCCEFNHPAASRLHPPKVNQVSSGFEMESVEYLLRIVSCMARRSRHDMTHHGVGSAFLHKMHCWNMEDGDSRQDTALATRLEGQESLWGDIGRKETHGLEGWDIFSREKVQAANKAVQWITKDGAWVHARNFQGNP